MMLLQFVWFILVHTAGVLAWNPESMCLMPSVRMFEAEHVLLCTAWPFIAVQHVVMLRPAFVIAVTVCDAYRFVYASVCMYSHVC